MTFMPKFGDDSKSPSPIYPGHIVRAMVDRPARDITLMCVASLFADRSTCDRLNVGAVIVRDGRVLSTGYNGAPAGMPHCDHTCTCMRNEIQDPPTGRHEPGCPAGPGCQNIVHAEANAIVFAAKHGVTIEGAELFTTHSPCRSCAMLIINAGITRVVFNILYRDTEPITMLQQRGIEVERL